LPDCVKVYVGVASIMSNKTVLSYRIPRSDCDVIHLHSEVYVKAVCVNQDVARLFLCDSTGAALPVQNQLGQFVTTPLPCMLKNVSTKKAVHMHNNEWLISWTNSYELWQEQTMLLVIESDRKHVFTHAKDY